ncbi:MAG: FAD-dependent oxidoreductase [Candidatus Acidoferrum typicum]|nr:FAD-dependent oxidoreductase [Candidatus Acidoferrum typicum]
MSEQRFGVAVIGAGVFGAWTAWHLARRGRRVLLVDAYGPGNARASSAGESRIIRMGYGADELYTRWSQRSLAQWKEFFAATRHALFHETGVLWLAGTNETRVQQTIETLRRCGVPFQELSRAELERRYPQIGLDGITKGLLEPNSGVLMARRAVAAVVEDAMRGSVEYRVAQIAEPRAMGPISFVTTTSGERIEAEHFVFACGAWLGKLFPEILGARIFPSRQEVFFFGVPAGDSRFAPPALPTWLFQEDEIYGMPDLESRGLKFALDRHGEKVDPDTQSRLPTVAGADEARRFVEQRFPALRGAPIVETRVCQYENTWNGDFLIDRHPGIENVWFVGGGSGHGFKHGPAVGEYLAARILEGSEGEPRFSLASKEMVQKRAVF